MRSIRSPVGPAQNEDGAQGAAHGQTKTQHHIIIGHGQAEDRIGPRNFVAAHDRCALDFGEQVAAEQVGHVAAFKKAFPPVPLYAGMVEGDNGVCQKGQPRKSHHDRRNPDALLHKNQPDQPEHNGDPVRPALQDAQIAGQ